MDRLKHSCLIAVFLVAVLILPDFCVSAANPKLNYSECTLTVGQKQTLKLKNTSGKIVWSTSAKKVATVSKKGVVTAKKAGTAVITATNKSKKYVCVVTVVKKASLNKTKISLKVGKTYKLKLKNATASRFVSEDDNVASVSTKGVIKAKNNGKTTITVIDTNNNTYSCKVTVTISEKTAVSGKIPSDAQSFNGHYYKIYLDSSISWDEAKKKCSDLGGHLVTITSSKEQDFVEKINSSNERLWIGGYCDSNYKWYWVTGEKWSYSNWGSGEPSGGSENSAAVWPKYWNDMTADNLWEQNGYICEWDDNLDTQDTSNPTVTSKPVITQAPVATQVITPTSTIKPNSNEAKLYNNHYYKIFFEDNLSWEEAKKKCIDMGGHLVTITSSEEQEFIEKINSSNERLWIGGYCDSNYKWYWVTGESWDYSNWEIGEPSGGDEKCAAVWPERWNDMSSDNLWEQNGFICEWDNSIDVGTIVTSTPAITPTPTSAIIPSVTVTPTIVPSPTEKPIITDMPTPTVIPTTVPTAGVTVQPTQTPISTPQVTITPSPNKIFDLKIIGMETSAIYPFIIRGYDKSLQINTIVNQVALKFPESTYLYDQYRDCFVVSYTVSLESLLDDKPFYTPTKYYFSYELKDASKELVNKGTFSTPVISEGVNGVSYFEIDTKNLNAGKYYLFIAEESYEISNDTTSGTTSGEIIDNNEGTVPSAVIKLIYEDIDSTNIVGVGIRNYGKKAIKVGGEDGLNFGVLYPDPNDSSKKTNVVLLNPDNLVEVAEYQIIAAGDNKLCYYLLENEQKVYNGAKIGFVFQYDGIKYICVADDGDLQKIEVFNP